MRICITCPCGAEFDADDPQNQYAKGDWRLTADGDRFAIQVTVRKWIESHERCAVAWVNGGKDNE